MNTAQFTKPSVLIAIGMVCASVAMLTQNSIAAAHHAANPLPQAGVIAVTELPQVVVTGKRLTTEEKAQYRRLLKTSAATLI